MTLGIAMFAGRFLMIVPMLAVAGNLANKRHVPASAGTFPVTTPLFTVLLTSVIVIVGALTFVPCAQPRPCSGTPFDAGRPCFLVFRVKSFLSHIMDSFAALESHAAPS